MSKMRWLTWYGILHKRLLKKPGFAVILCAILLLTGLMTAASRERAGFLHVAVAAQQTDAAAERTIARLQDGNRLVRVTVCATPQEAIEMVEAAEVDTAWVFEADLEERIARVADGKRETLVQVYAVEDSTFVRSSREMLYGALFPDIAYDVYERFVREELPGGEDIPADELRETYAYYGYEDGVIEFSYLDLTNGAYAQTSYLTSPLRGLLMVMMLFCGLAATMYYKNDEKKQVFSLLSVEKRLLVFFGNNLAAVSVAAVFVTAALLLAGLYTDPLHETVMMVLFVLMTAGFCTLLGTLCPSNAVLGALLPAVLVANIALCPVFVNVRAVWAQLLLPGYYYLYGVNDLRFAWQALVYCAAVYLLTYLLYCKVINQREA